MENGGLSLLNSKIWGKLQTERYLKAFSFSEPFFLPSVLSRASVYASAF